MSILLRKAQTVLRLAQDIARGDPKQLAWVRWRLTRGDTTLRLRYPLASTSVVLDVGGYTGDWAAEIVQRYDPNVFIFEPIPEYIERLNARFKGHSKVKVLPYGLSDHDGEVSMRQVGDGSGEFRSEGVAMNCAVRDIDSVWKELSWDDVALIKVNIEGGEYQLLRRMLDIDLVKHCRDLQIQFHDFVHGAITERAHIRNRLQSTHALSYDYPFIWEGWTRRFCV